MEGAMEEEDESEVEVGAAAAGAGAEAAGAGAGAAEVEVEAEAESAQFNRAARADGRLNLAVTIGRSPESVWPGERKQREKMILKNKRCQATTTMKNN